MQGGRHVCMCCGMAIVVVGADGGGWRLIQPRPYRTTRAPEVCMYVSVEISVMYVGLVAVYYYDNSHSEARGRNSPGRRF